MHFARSVPAVIILATGLALAGLAGYATHLFRQQSLAVESGEFATLRAIIDFNLRGAEERALARAEMIAAMPAVQAHFAAGDRDKLYAELASLYRIQTDKYGVAQAQFHTPPATSFLRLNAPERFGEDLSSFRPIVVAANSDKAARKGLSVGRSGPAIFGVTPVFDAAGRHLGSFEIGLDFGPMLDKLKSAYGIESALFFDEATLRSVATGLSGDQLDEHNRVGSFLRLHSTNWALMRPLAEGADLALVNGKDVEYRRSSERSPYAVVLMAMRRPDGTPIGVIAAARDLSASHGASARTGVALGATTLAVFVLLAGIVIVGIRGLLLRPLQRVTDELDALATGKPPARERDTASCSEIAALQAGLDRLRQRLPPGDAP